MDARTLGRFGEEKAAAYLRRKGYAIRERNFTCRGGEIDIVAENKSFIVFVEVKLRKNADFASAREFVTAAKQQRIIKTAQIWLMKTHCEKQPRFDVVEVYAPFGENGRITINHIENAFM